MRIISGNFKGKKIFLPNDKFTRPLRDMVKESIFNLITHSNKINVDIKDSSVLDLFSGSGSFGLECLSRGAKKVTFFENYSQAIITLEKNIKSVKAENYCQIIKENCFEFFKFDNRFQNSFKIIFIDPPFKEMKINHLIEMIIKNKILQENGIIILHRHIKDKLELSSKLKIVETRTYGISKITFGN
tara:strand:- start:1375 stop:1935 length:561 start_codon:yes stop_codon:yes gene_type:complete